MNDQLQDPRPPILVAEALSAGYGDRIVVQSADLAFQPGTLTALLGPNGSGKSTLLSAMARLLPTRAGAALLDGKSIHKMSTRDVARRLGVLPQAPVLPEAITALDLVSFGRKPHLGVLRQWTDADTRAVEHAMQLTGTLPFADQLIDGLSGGQRQRCWIAMALAQETDIILLDEPTTFLDLKYQVEIMDLLHRLVHEHGRTLITVLHDLNLALAYADRVVMMKDGSIRADLMNPSDCTVELVRDVFEVDVVAIDSPAHQGRPLFMPQRALHLASEGGNV